MPCGAPYGRDGTLQAMRFAGSASWRFAEGIEQAPVVALFVRDTLGLEVPAESVIPPRLDGDLPDYSALVAAEQRSAAGAAWTGWWQEVVAQDVRRQQGPPASVDQRVWLRQWATEHRAAFDPPEFASLADRPALAKAVQVTLNGALRWADARRRALLIPPQGQPGQFDYDVVRAAAEQIARRHGVSPDALRACAVILPVDGIWWNRFAPGAVLCSVHTARDPGIARSMLTEAFESGLAN